VGQAQQFDKKMVITMNWEETFPTTTHTDQYVQQFTHTRTHKHTHRQGISCSLSSFWIFVPV
jgi:hypothetical protein